jgi:dienelactone hydrolase
MRQQATFLVLIFSVYGCGTDGSSERVPGDVAIPMADVGQSADGGMVVDGSTEPDALLDAGVGPVDSAVSDAATQVPDTGPWTPPPVAEVVELEPVQVSPWMRALIGDGDPLYDIFESGDFEMPEAGVPPRPAGVRWVSIEADEDSTISAFGPSNGYVVGEIELEEGEHIVVRADRAAQMWSRVSVQPADFYGSGRSLMPLPHQGNSAVVAVRPLPRRGPPRIQIFKTTDEVVFNPSDVTWPHLLVGHQEPLPLGIPLVNNLRRSLRTLTARVVESEHFEASAVRYPGLPAGATTQIAFQLIPKAAWREADTDIPVRIRVDSPSLEWSYEREITVPTRDPNQPYRRTFRSPIDGSVQYYGVRPPTEVDPENEYSLVLSLHGAGVEAINQASSYAAKHWAYVIAPTNRRPFGFDWEEWGRFNALAALDHAIESFSIDETRVYLTGHSMGGHGTWHVGTSTPGRFAVLGPSAGWESFYSYGGSSRPSGPFARARAHSDTLNYLSNISERGVYIVHGDADDNVPILEGRNMFAAASMHTQDIAMHEQPGAGHWWNGDAGPGVDCVDWPPMFQFMKRRRLDPFEADFNFVSESPSYSPEHSFVRVETANSPMADFVVNSRRSGAGIAIETTNVRTLRLDAEALTAMGIMDVTVDGAAVDLEMPYTYIGSREGKRSDQYGPFNQVFRAPFCFVYPTDGGTYAKTAAYFASYWTLIGNGHACGLTADDLTEETIEQRNLIRMGDAAAAHQVAPFSWDEDGLYFEGQHVPSGAVMYVTPEGERLSAVLVTTEGATSLLHQIVPFSSRSGMPDYLMWTENGAVAAGFFDSMWQFNTDLGVP